ncbi:hypothetical protein GH714_016220 [Hevea brasiliensis]|uniref:Uncharacterized protein n=1 Tax=Hevea brasiliensis TaxID=3981 RepID=A0A6A6L6P8_HEVBR|nr:hypothetical protein GH714_016220 [Hevea brasiliensis]
MEGEASADFRDWELLVNSDADPINSPNSANNSRSFDEIEADSEGVLRLDYFSLENDKRYAKTVVDASEEVLLSLIIPVGLIPGRRLGIRGGILVNSGPIRGVIGIGEIEGKDGEEGKFLSREGFEEFGENRSKDKDLGTFWSDSSGDSLGFADVGDMNEGSEVLAVMGFVILGRRLYKMKRKMRSLPLKVTVDDKDLQEVQNIDLA